MISLDAVTRLQSEQIVRPQTMEEEVRRGATRAVAGHPGFAAIGVKDANLEIRIVGGGPCRYGNAISTRAIVTIANTDGKAAEVAYACELIGFEDKIIVAETLKFGEPHIWSAPAERSGDGALIRCDVRPVERSKAASPDRSGLPPHSKLRRRFAK